MGYIYILTNKNRTTLYVGVTSDLRKRIDEHKHHHGSGFTRKYNLTTLVYFEEYSRIQDAIVREKQLKAGSRAKKLQLIEAMNPEWKDLYLEL